MMLAETLELRQTADWLQSELPNHQLSWEKFVASKAAARLTVRERANIASARLSARTASQVVGAATREASKVNRAERVQRDEAYDVARAEPTTRPTQMNSQRSTDSHLPHEQQS